ncbi:MAG: helix-turn-helix domain-containing protein [Lysobacteraceae bacterium]|nr:MAG: helix-turn-helix domain-containing protein [Xanthomonadaceae bacterium]
MTSAHAGIPEAARGIGEKLRNAREGAGLSVTEAAARMHVPTHIVQALENEDWARIGAPVFVRGQLRSYSRLLGLPNEDVSVTTVMPAARPSELVPRTYTPRMQRMAEQTARRLVYVVITAAIAVPVWLATQSHLDGDAQQTVPLDAQSPSAAPSERISVADVQAQPLVASMTPMPQKREAEPPASSGLNVSFNGESWVKISAPDGSLIEQALIPAGQQRDFAPGQVGSAVLGNATALTVQYRGQTLDLTPYIRANVVRFTVSSDGSLQPVGR